MLVFARQFGHPHGLLGRLVGRIMARSNANLNRWVVQELASLGRGDVERIVELGPGPGVGLEETLRVFPEARVWGVDLSGPMLSQSRTRNLREVESGRVTLLEGSVSSLIELAPIDLVMAVHVLYFWHEPAGELSQLHQALRSGGRLALGYQLKQHMPRVSQINFPRLGHVLYESDEQLTTLLREAGFKTVSILVKGPPDDPDGRLALAEA